jgi:hypothetical protein
MRPRSALLLLSLALPLACPAQDMIGDDPALDGLLQAEPINVARMTDSDLSCEQLYAESGVIEQRIARMPQPADPMELSARMQQDMMAGIEKQQNAMRARSVASGVLSMVPGVGGLAASALAPKGGMPSGMDEQMSRYMQEVQQMQLQMRALAEQKARMAHVTNLFLARGCKVSTLDQARLQAARQDLESAPGPAAAGPVAAPMQGHAPANVGATQAGLGPDGVAPVADATAAAMAAPAPALPTADGHDDHASDTPSDGG